MSPAPAADAASVVTQLRAFLSQPERHRGEFGGGRASREGGHHIFKFAQGKLPPGVDRDMAADEREELRRAALAFIREVCFRDGASHYQLLGLPADAKREAVKENYHLLMALIHPDRAEHAREAWPADWAQRVNRAYAVLDDDATRASYDEALHARETIAAGARRAPAPQRRRGRRVASFKVRFAKALVVVVAVVGTLLLLEIWVDDAREEGFSFAPGSRGRDIGVSAERPRFLGRHVVPAHDNPLDPSPPAGTAENLPMLAPLWRDSPSAPALEPRPARPAPTAQAAAPVIAGESEAAPPIPDAAADPDAFRAVVAQAAAPAPPAPAAKLTTADIEIVVARLIGYYEAGEADNLMALVDSRQAGFWQAARMRQAYADFFRATRERRLRVKTLDWQTASASAHAQGQATLEAQYADAPGGLQRDIDVEMEIALRDGQVKITRLSLFPSVP